MKNNLLTILAAIIGLLLLTSTFVLILAVLAALAACYFGLVVMTHRFITNNWIAIPIDLCILGAVYSVFKTSREHFSSNKNKEE